MKSKVFKQAKDQFGKLNDFIFQIDTLNKIIVEKKIFYKLNLTSYDSIYVGKSNDTIFSFDQSLRFKEIFVILNKENDENLGRLGTDFNVRLESFNDSIFNFSFGKIKNREYDDHIIMDYEYPELTISNMSITKKGKIVDLKIEQEKK
ncbi:hypothetical protein KH5_12430 [Urechidicola sp. KH5]